MTKDRKSHGPTAAPLTRREVLKRFGAMGGASMMIGAMDAWGLAGPSAGRPPELEGTPPATQVLILGAGISGLVLGYELGKRGYQYRILEARDRVGGLAWTVKRGAEHTEIGGERQVCDFDEGQYINVGPMRIPHQHTGVLGYCRELGVSLERFVNASDANYFFEEDPYFGSLAGKKVRLREVKADLWGATGELLAKAIAAGDVDLPLSQEDEWNLLGFLQNAGFVDWDTHAYIPPAQRGGDGAHDLRDLVRSGFGRMAVSFDMTGGRTPPLFQPVGGMMEIPLAFQRAIGQHISFGCEVRSIRQTEDQVRVAFRDLGSGEEREETADYCVSCLPMSVLQGLDVDLSPAMAEAVGLARHGGAAKMGLQMARRFWEEDEGIYGGHLWSGSLQLGEFTYPSHDYWAKKGVLLGFYAGGPTADLETQPVRARVEYVLANASRVHPQIREEFESAYAVWWNRVPYSLGAFATTPAPEVLEQLVKADRRFYVGAAGASSSPAWMEGAIEAAWRTAEAIHARVMQEGG